MDIDVQQSERKQSIQPITAVKGNIKVTSMQRETQGETAYLCLQYICRIGTVHRITDRGDVRVQYSNNIRWTFHPGALTKVQICFCRQISHSSELQFSRSVVGSSVCFQLIFDILTNLLIVCVSFPQVNTFGVGELVRVLEDMESVKRLQAGHGEWTDSMAPVCSFSLMMYCMVA